jgi:hypothetical protein
VVTSVPLVVGLYFGRYVLKLDPLLLLGGIAGAQTMAAGYAAIQERTGSSVAVLGYSATGRDWSHPAHHLGNGNRAFGDVMANTTRHSPD